MPERPIRRSRASAPSAGQNASATTQQQNVYDWIVQFDTASLGGISSVAQTASLLAGGGIEFQVFGGLGLAGRCWCAVRARRWPPSRTGWPPTSTWPASSKTPSASSTASPNDPQYGQLWGMTEIDAPDAWNITTGSSQRGGGRHRHRRRLHPSRPGRQHLDEPRRNRRQRHRRRRQRLRRRRPRLRFRQQRRQSDGRQRPRHARRRHDRRGGQQRPGRGGRQLVRLDHGPEVPRQPAARATSPTPSGPSTTPR